MNTQLETSKVVEPYSAESWPKTPFFSFYFQALAQKLNLPVATNTEGSWQQLCNNQDIEKTVLKELQLCGTKGM